MRTCKGRELNGLIPGVENVTRGISDIFEKGVPNDHGLAVIHITRGLKAGPDTYTTSGLGGLWICTYVYWAPNYQHEQVCLLGVMHYNWEEANVYLCGPMVFLLPAACTRESFGVLCLISMSMCFWKDLTKEHNCHIKITNNINETALLSLLTRSVLL